jgi:hypothetical protein
MICIYLSVLDPVNYSLYIKLLNMGKVTSLPRFCIQMEILRFDTFEIACPKLCKEQFQNYDPRM